MRLLFLFAFSALSISWGQPPGGPNGMGDGIWRRNAYWGEAQTFDSCVGHQPGNGQYHHHANPICLRAQLNDNVERVKMGRTGATYREKSAPWTHSPILGWAIDGYPIYGPYGYSDARDPGSEVKRLKSGYRLRDISGRDSLPDWALPNHPGVSKQLGANRQGPPVGSMYPLGRYAEDYEFVPGLGDLDVYNGRFEVTPEFPDGTYAYHVTLDEEGNPAFPYVIGGELRGNVTGGRARNAPAGLEEYFGATASGPPVLRSWMTADSDSPATVVTGYDPSAGASTTWPDNAPAGARIAGGVSHPTNANVQRVRHDAGTVYVDANGLPSYTMGPWFDPAMAGSVFSNFPAGLNAVYQFPRAPAEAAAKSASGLGAQGVWVNGVAMFNFLDGGSYSNATGRDAGGGIVNPSAVQVSAASGEPGPAAPGSLVRATSIFGAQLATFAESADGGNWPTSLGGATVSVRDSSGVTRPARLSEVSPDRVEFQVPPETATGFGTVTYSAGGNSYSAGIQIVSAYPNLFVDARNKAMRDGDAAYLAIYGSGRGAFTQAAATVGGKPAEVIEVSEQGGFDRFMVRLPSTIAASGPVEVIVTVDGRPSNAVTVELP